MKDEAMHALSRWIKAHGRRWRSALLQAWTTGDYAGHPDGELLHHLRKSRGPCWLAKHSARKLCRS
jgi:hypothetical protein